MHKTSCLIIPCYKQAGTILKCLPMFQFKPARVILGVVNMSLAIPDFAQFLDSFFLLLARLFTNPGSWQCLTNCNFCTHEHVLLSNTNPLIEHCVTGMRRGWQTKTLGTGCLTLDDFLWDSVNTFLFSINLKSILISEQIRSSLWERGETKQTIVLEK